MGVLILFGVISVLWGVLGLILTVVPTVWVAFVQKTMNNPGQRFWLTQGMLLMGLVLIIGTAPFQGFWLWVGCGVIMVLKACLLLGSSVVFRDRLTTLATSWPMWVYRVSGILALALAVLLAADIILYG